VVDALGVGHEGRAEGGLANEADDAGGDVLVLGVAEGGLQVGLGEASLVEEELELLEVGARQLAGAGDDGLERGEGVLVVRSRKRRKLSR
jgi:hypothetical protein